MTLVYCPECGQLEQVGDTPLVHPCSIIRRRATKALEAGKEIDIVTGKVI